MLSEIAACTRKTCRVAGPLIAVALSLSGGCALCPKSTVLSPAASPVLTAVPDVLQSTEYSCGAAALQAVLAYYGVVKYEDELIELLGSNEEIGTTYESIVRVAEAQGLRSRIAENLTLDDLRAAIKEGVPVVVCFQAWVDAKPPAFSWAESWEEGHMAVVIGVDAEYVYLEDPSLFGSRGRIPLREFDERWHDEDFSGTEGLADRGRRWNHPGIVLRRADARSWRPPPFSDVP